MDIDLHVIEQYRTKFTTIWNTVNQQDTALLEPYVTLMPNCSGKDVELPYIGKTRLKERKQRLEPVAWEEIDTGKRRFKPIQYQQFIPMSTDDKMFMDNLQLTSSQLIEEERKAAARTRDEVILGVIDDNTGGWRIRTTADGTVGGILGQNYTGNDGATLVDIDAANVVPVDFAMKGTKTDAGMLLDKMIEAKRILETNYSYKEGSGDTLCMAITPQQKAEIIFFEQSMNKNYGFQSLVHGKVNPIIGINFLVTNMLPNDDDGNRICPVWLKSKVVLGAWENPKFRIDVRQDFVDVIQVGVTCAYGSTRKDDESFVKVLCKEPTA